MAVKVLEDKHKKSMKESFHFKKFEDEMHKINLSLRDILIELEEAIDEDIEDNNDGAIGGRNITPGLAEKIYSEFKSIYNDCDEMMRILSSNYKF